MNPVKVNYKLLDGSPTSTTLSWSVCKFYSRLNGIENKDYKNFEEYVANVRMLVQSFVYNEQKLNTEKNNDFSLSKDYLETIMLCECERILKRKYLELD